MTNIINITIIVIKGENLLRNKDIAPTNKATIRM